ncbi:MAG: nitroreductase family protein [Desulfobacterota bacterium]|nr:nitroreductase family protein [Thermodesulfobacteriota bacterium]
MELMEAIKGRRSIRRYRPDPVPEEALRTILEAVRWSPSWANTQCWEVVVVRDPVVKAELAATLTPTNPARSAMTEAPLVIVLCGKKGVSGFKKGEAMTVKGDWLMFDTGMAMQSLCLAAHALGLATVVVGLFDHRKAEAILTVPPDREVVAMTPLGYPASEATPPKRKELSEFVFQDRYH